MTKVNLSKAQFNAMVGICELAYDGRRQWNSSDVRTATLRALSSKGLLVCINPKRTNHQIFELTDAGREWCEVNIEDFAEKMNPVEPEPQSAIPDHVDMVLHNRNHNYFQFYTNGILRTSILKGTHAQDYSEILKEVDQWNKSRFREWVDSFTRKS